MGETVKVSEEYIRLLHERGEIDTQLMRHMLALLSVGTEDENDDEESQHTSPRSLGEYLSQVSTTQ